MEKLSEKTIAEIDSFEREKLNYHSSKARFIAQLNVMKEMLLNCNENLIQSEQSYQILEDLQTKLKA